MKKTKTYKPRRGIRFARPRNHGTPTVSFIGGGAPIEPVDTSGSLMSSLKEDDTTRVVISSSVAYGNTRPTRLLNNSMLGVTNRGSGRPYSTVIAAITASTPSWTQSAIGFNHAFVGQVLSASAPELSSLNYFRSGTEALEQSPVPASGVLYYSKQEKYRTLTVKKTASFFDTVFIPDEYTPISFAAGTGSLISTVTGTLNPDLPATPPMFTPGRYGQLSSNVWAPACFQIDVPVSGRIVDLKVWIEIVQLSASHINGAPHLSTLGIALRSPNVTFGHAHPIRNSSVLQRIYTSDDTDYSTFGSFFYGGATTVGRKFFENPPHKFFRDTFILWEGPNFNQVGFGTSSVGQRWPTFANDRSMRTVFSDGAPVPNPRHLIGTTTAINHNGAPHVGAGKTPTVHGNDTPWTSDTTIFPATESLQTAGSPPAGWLTAPGGVAAINEWPTTGVNYGTNTIQPLYPLLESITQRKVVTGEFFPTRITGSQIEFNPSQWVGSRPGLRGTEMSGTWKLLIYDPYALGAGVYFRQARLEFTYEPNSRGPTEIRRSRKGQSYRSGQRLLGRISGSDMLGIYTESEIALGSTLPSASWDSWINETYEDVSLSNEIGRTFGLQLNTGSFDRMQSALVYKLTGTLADVSGSAPGWLLNNRFGMPMIPESSATLAPYSEYVPSTSQLVAVQEFMLPTKTLDGARKLSDVARTINPPLTLVEIAADFVSGSTR